ncbi:recombinase RecA [endosymbiont GvMRE of Glomus versiforme]|uniref:recombinase RecA n=1 Tax=endosymbiont GvMRE of Glomus versiforme TaxID=2039283 RepID=UPI000EDF3941|nr:ATPase domain-containing protein [endosymbiont GvMRE of Glomus versiforme]RHZ35577.1 Protein RecA [endosymbiont GvMRE of Glomus versiforme]
MTAKKETKNEKDFSLSQEIKNIIEEITKEYGEGIITTLGKSKFKDQPTLSTGSIILDREIGGGYPFGKIVEIYGENASGKTTLALHAVRECQKLGKQTVWFDIENALNVKHAQNIGVDIDKLFVLHPEYGEQAFKLLIHFINKGAGIIVIDSLAPLIPIELLGDFDKQVIGAYARMINNGLRQINHEMTNRETVIIFINQLRNKISTGFFMGNPKTTTGGVALTYYASLRIELKNKKEKIEKEGEYIGMKFWAQIIKNRSITSFLSSKENKEKLIEVMFKGGIQKEREIIDLATEINIIQKSGNWYSYEEKKLGNGKENAVDYLLENPELYQEILKNVIEKSNK